MSQDETLRTLLTELMGTFDDTIDTSSGSNFDTTVMSPFLERIGGSPLDVDFESFMVERLQTEVPDIDVSQYSGVRNLLIQPATAILNPIRREINAIKVAQSLNNYDQMTRDEVNALLGNYFLALRDGGRSTGVVRLYYTSPQAAVVTPITQFSTGNALNFFPTVVQSITATQMSFNFDGNLYTFDITVQSEDTGAQYNVAAGDINTVVSLVGVTRVSNPAAFTDATDEETTEEGVARAQESITIRNLAVERGISVVLSEQFSSATTIQAIGFSDDEMQRDVVVGPVDVSSIPGGILGKTVPSLGAGNEIHIGGKTDVYVYQEVPVTDSLDFENLTDKGVRLFANTTGFTEASASPTTIEFKDERGHFTVRGIMTGDFLRLDNVETRITSVSSDTLTLNTAVATGQFGKTYEIVRYTDGLIQVPLYDLIAEVGDAPFFDPAGDPVVPIPGSETNEPLLIAGVPVVKTENIAKNNVFLPLLRASTIEFLDPLTLEASGVFIPMRDPLLATNPDEFTGGTISTQATGTMRLYFRDAVGAWVTDTLTRFLDGIFPFQPVKQAPIDPPSPGTAQVLVEGGFPHSILTLDNYNYTVDSAGGLAIKKGYRITFSGVTYTVMADPTFDGVNTKVTVREVFTLLIGSSQFFAHAGILEAEMPQDPASGLYYWDFEVEASINGVSGNAPAATTFVFSNVNSEGWSLKTFNPVTAYSTRELPHLEFTHYVNDTTDLTDIFTAYAIRANYDYASSLPAIQEFVEEPTNRIIGEDILIKHFLPAYFRWGFTVQGLTSAAAELQVATYVNDLAPTSDLEGSDLITDLGSIGATHVLLPITLVALEQDTSRTWTARIDADTLGSNRIQHFIADTDFIVATEET